MLYRKIEAVIESHLKSNSQKILLIDGARQVGKTYIIRHVGQKLFENYIEINIVFNTILIMEERWQSFFPIPIHGPSGARS